MDIFEDFMENIVISMQIPSTIAYLSGSFYLFFSAYYEMKIGVLATVPEEMALPGLVLATYLYFGMEQCFSIFDTIYKVLSPKSTKLDYQIRRECENLSF